MKINDLIKVEITDTDYQGFGIGHVDDYTVFIKGALLKEIVLAKVMRITKTVIFAEVSDFLLSSPNRIEPQCPYYFNCGGCQLMHAQYDTQLAMKRHIVDLTIKKLHKQLVINECIGAENTFFYRNKIQAPVAKRESIVRGLYMENSHNFVEISKCIIEPEHITQMFDNVLRQLNTKDFTTYNEKTNTGLLRHIVIRTNSKKELMVIIVVTSYNRLVESVLSELNCHSIYLNINNKKSNVILGDKYIHIKGGEYLTEEIDNIKYFVHPNSFMQINYEQMVKLYNHAIALADLSMDDTVVDAYCGFGAITLLLAKTVKHVYGIEVVSEAIKNASHNAKTNDISNAYFIQGKCEDEISKLTEMIKIDALFVDPPRKGCDQAFLDAAIKARIPKIVYISCSPKSLARDIKYLDADYEVSSITPIDLFPQTNSIETICIMKHRSSE